MIRASLTLASRPTSGTRGTSDRKDAWAASHAFQIGRLDLWEEKARASHTPCLLFEAISICSTVETSPASFPDRKEGGQLQVKRTIPASVALPSCLPETRRGLALIALLQPGLPAVTGCAAVLMLRYCTVP